jgi:hypothetical protein
MKLIPSFALLLAATLPVHAELKLDNIAKGKGMLTCSGGGGAKPLFSAECKTISITRVSGSDGIKYEITCTDSGNTTFLLACDAFAFEQKQVVF